MSTEVPASFSDELRLEVDALRRRVEALEQHISAPGTAPDSLSGEVLIPQIIDITRELFPGEVSIRRVDDPENPPASYTVVEARASGDIADIVDRRLLWHQRVAALSDRCRDFCLSLSDAK